MFLSMRVDTPRFTRAEYVRLVYALATLSGKANYRRFLQRVEPQFYAQVCPVFDDIDADNATAPAALLSEARG